MRKKLVLIVLVEFLFWLFNLQFQMEDEFDEVVDRQAVPKELEELEVFDISELCYHSYSSREAF